jgi:hypothetical protein
MYYEDSTMNAAGTTEYVDDGYEWDEDHTCVWMPVEQSDILELNEDPWEVRWKLDQKNYIESL